MRPLPFGVDVYRSDLTKPSVLHVIFTPMPFAYYAKLSAGRQRIYRKSDAIERLDLPAGVAAGAHVARIREGLGRDDRSAVQSASQQLIDVLVAGYRVPRIRVRVLAQRPADETGELHGLYEPE